MLYEKKKGLKTILLISAIVLIGLITTIIFIKQNSKAFITIEQTHKITPVAITVYKYEIYRNGEIYKDTSPKGGNGADAPVGYATSNKHELIKKISKEELRELIESIEKLNDSEYIIDDWYNSNWSYEINNTRYYVKDINLYEYALEKYLDED